MTDPTRLNGMSYVFEDTNQKAAEMLRLRAKGSALIGDMLKQSGSLESRREVESFCDKTEDCLAVRAAQLELAREYCGLEAAHKQRLSKVREFRRELHRRGQFLATAEFELYCVRRLKKTDIARLLELPERTLEKHIIRLREYAAEQGSIPSNRVADALREVIHLRQVFKAAVPEVPADLQSVMAADPSALIPTMSEEELKRCRGALSKHLLSDIFAADSAWENLRELGSAADADVIRRCTDLMTYVTRDYACLDAFAADVERFHRIYYAFIRNERRKSADA